MVSRAQALSSVTKEDSAHELPACCRRSSVNKGVHLSQMAV